MSLAYALAALISIPGVGRSTALKISTEFEKNNISIDNMWGTKGWLHISSKFVSENTQTNIIAFQKQWSLKSYQHFLEEKEIQVLSFQDQAYPTLLTRIPDFPVVLFAKGNLDCLRPRHIAIVGSRKPTQYGKWVTQQLVSDLVQEDVAIVSGFMVGIDYKAHQVAKLLQGRSVGVLGFGFDYFYPQHMERAAVEFLDAGQLLITEYPPATIPVGGQFAARNRIVAGLSAATIVVEAQKKSGSLITAQCALDFDRCVGAVPGPIDSVLSDGTHHLIREGAALIRCGQDILDEIAPLQAVRILVKSDFSPDLV